MSVTEAWRKWAEESVTSALDYCQALDTSIRELVGQIQSLREEVAEVRRQNVKMATRITFLRRVKKELEKARAEQDRGMREQVKGEVAKQLSGIHDRVLTQLRAERTPGLRRPRSNGTQHDADAGDRGPAPVDGDQGADHVRTA